MKKKVLALLLGGLMAVSGLFVSMPATVQAATVKFEDCEDSTSHIRSAQVATVDGKLTVTIDVVFETVNGQYNLYVFDHQLEKRDVGIFSFYDTSDGRAAELEDIKDSGTYTFDGLSAGKTYYVYCNVEDNHEAFGWGEGGDPNDIYWHYAAYLGSNASSSDPSGSVSSGSTSTACVEVKEAEPGISYEEELADRITEAQPGATIVMDKGVTALSNSVMKELLEKKDVSLRMEFTYQDKEYVIVIPAGAAIDSDIPWYGPLYLAQQYGNRAGTNTSAASGTGTAYEVQSGDSLSRIAAANNMTLKQLLAKNPQIKDPDKIAVGQKINR